MMNEEQIIRKNRSYVLHVLRNPYGWSEEVVREVRLMAANELERLYRMELLLKEVKDDLEEAIKDK